MKANWKSQRRKARKAKKVKNAQRAKRSPRRKLRRAVGRFLPSRIFAGLPAHGNTKWSPRVLAIVALLFTLSNEDTLAERHEMSRDIARFWFPSEFLATTYRGFIKALVRHGGRLVEVVSEALRTQMLSLSGEKGKVAGLTPFIVDGSKVAAPWTRANEQMLGKEGRKPRGNKCLRNETDLRPQLTLTMLWHMPLGLPWAWMHGGLADGERTQFRSLLHTLPRRALIVADAGFVGYDLWNTIRRGERHFLIRVGGNVELLHSLVPGCRIGRDGQIVWLWPAGVQNKKAPPLKLRLITVKQGRQTWYLVTSLLDPELLNEQQAARLYARRWGIECCFRTLKQTYERHTMRSYTPECAAAELDWALLSLWLVSFLTKQELHEAKIDMDRYSPAGARRLIRRELRRQAEGKEELDVSDLRNAVKDSYTRRSKKTARHDQRKKRDPAAGAPKITKAANRQRQDAKALEQSQTTAA